MASKAQAKKTYQHFVPAAKPVPNWYENYNFILIESMEQLEKSFTDAGWVPGKSFMSFDTETTGLNFEELDLVGYSYCIDGKSTYYVPVEHFECPINLGEPAVEFIYNRMCEARQVFMYNARYDEHVLEARGVKDNLDKYSKIRWLFIKYDMSKVNVYDVMNAVFLADTNEKMPSLKGCFAAGTKVITTEGLKNIEDITTKDKIPMGNHEYKVTGSQCTGIKEVIELEFDDGSVYRCTPDHLFLVRYFNSDKCHWVQAKDLTDDMDIVRYEDYTSKSISKQFYKNSTKCIKIQDGELVPPGFIRGFLSNRKPNEWYNNGEINIQVPIGGEVPEGFVPGMKPHPYSEERRVEITKKRKQTNFERYGVEVPFQSEECKEKIRQTNLERRGVEYPMQSPEVQAKSKQTTLQNWGVEFYVQSDKFKEESKKTSLVHWGVEHPMQSSKVQEKKKCTCLETYGYDNPSKSPVIRDKVIKTNLLNWGVENVFQNEEIKEKSKQTNFNNLGFMYATQSPIVQEKAKQTSLEHWGVEHPMQSPIVRGKVRQATYKNLGVMSPAKSPKVREKMVESTIKSLGVPYPSQSTIAQEKIKQTNMEKYGVPWCCMRPEARKYTGNSLPNREFEGLLVENNISYEREFNLGHYSYDFKVGNTLIEINPYATHNILWNPFGRDGLDKNYHKKKSQLAIDNGYCCIHIFDWDDCDKIIKELLLPKERVYARNTNVCGIPQGEAEEFLNIHHLQGSCNGQEVILGLRDKYGELVSLMSFGKPRYNKNYEWELLRYCSGENVIGGAKKLFNHFLRECQPNNIISYCDNSKFSGNVYKKLGFTLKEKGKPSCHWYSPKMTENLQHITDNLLRQRGYDQLFNESYGKGTSNEELIIKRGYVPIYDCGQSVWIYLKGCKFEN